jgi:hypothetical protein
VDIDLDSKTPAIAGPMPSTLLEELGVDRVVEQDLAEVREVALLALFEIQVLLQQTELGKGADQRRGFERREGHLLDAVHHLAVVGAQVLENRLLFLAEILFLGVAGLLPSFALNWAQMRLPIMMRSL